MLRAPPRFAREAFLPELPSVSRPASPSDAFVELQQVLLSVPDVVDFLERAARLAASFASPPLSCGITVRHDTAVFTAAQSDDVAGLVDELQYSQGAGPCLHTMETGRPVSLPDLAEGQDWRDFRAGAMAHGVRSSLSLPITAETITAGALNVYSGTPEAFDETLTEGLSSFVQQISAGLTLAMRQADTTRLTAQVQEALRYRAVIDQAIGIIMAQQRCPASAAFVVLRGASQTRNRKLHDIAADLVLAVTGAPPEPPALFTRR